MSDPTSDDARDDFILQERLRHFGILFPASGPVHQLFQ